MNDESDNKRSFNLAAFRELKEGDLPQQLSSPVSVAVINEKYSHNVLDDGVIHRIYKSPFEGQRNSLRTTPKMLSNKYYYCPSNTIVASNGGVYHVEPFMLPPPQQISEMIRGLTATQKSKDFHSSSFSSNSPEKRRTVDKTFNSVIEESHYEDESIENIPTEETNNIENVRNNLQRRASDPDLSVKYKQKLFLPSPISKHSSNRDLKSDQQSPNINSNSTSVQTPRGTEEFFKEFSFFRYLQTEMLGMGETSNYESNAIYKIKNFLHVPLEVEQLIYFGLFICIDAFLYVITYLPIRVVIALLALIVDIIKLPVVIGEKSQHQFTRINRFDIMRGLLFLLGCYILKLLNMSRVYHYIRGQTLIKLYVLTAMLEVFDRLLGSFGQDAFESLHVQTKDHPLKWNNILTYCVVSLYVIIHSTIYFIYAATLLVAINSAEQQLITVLFLNNFAEIKSFVFKKFDRISLFQLTCGDITERFQLILFLSLIMIVSVAQAGENWGQAFKSQCYVFILMVSGESIADWIKHAFIAKFNSLDSTVYEDMARVLRKDIISMIQDKIVVDHNYAIIRRVGLSQIPLGCVSARYIMLALDSPAIREYTSFFSLYTRICHAALIFCVLLMLKVISGVSLIYLSGWLHNRDLQAKTENFPHTSSAKLKEQRELMIQLSNIERYTLYRGRVHG